MEIATWNVNSIRTRLPQVLGWLAVNPHIDLLCVQETKVTDQDFPAEAFTQHGYYTYAYGQKSYNGVAMISKQPLENVCGGFAQVLGDDLQEIDQQKRLLSGRIEGIRVLNLYVPNGADLGSDKYVYKLQWLKYLAQYVQRVLAQEQAIVLCGDFNVALTDLDRASDRQEESIMASIAERSALQTILDLGFVDIFRQWHQDKGHYTWWDYRGGAFRRNLGWRIDYHFVSTALVPKVKACTIDVTPRRNQQPSDHTPVILSIED
jgi:exodeoxyribonuclease-3